MITKTIFYDIIAYIKNNIRCLMLMNNKEMEKIVNKERIKNGYNN